jgi:predicted regulator of Ras-like GTPase activity (Roadblock/LC7/MglB family)
MQPDAAALQAVRPAAVANTDSVFSLLFAAVQADCADLNGVLVTSPEGLVLATRGTLEGDTAAAAAAHIATELQTALSMLDAGRCVDVLFWTASALWALARMDRGQVLLVECAAQCRPGLARLVLARLRRDLLRVLE